MWVDERIDNGTINKNKILDKYIYLFLKKVEIKTLKASNSIVVLTHKAKKELVNIHQIKKDKISLILVAQSIPRTISIINNFRQ